MEDVLQLVTGIVGFLLFLLLIFMVYLVGESDGIRKMEVKAVEQGYAEWVTDSSGHSEFQWISPTQESEDE